MPVLLFVYVTCAVFGVSGYWLGGGAWRLAVMVDGGWWMLCLAFEIWYLAIFLR